MGGVGGVGVSGVTGGGKVSAYSQQQPPYDAQDSYKSGRFNNIILYNNFKSRRLRIYMFR